MFLETVKSPGLAHLSYIIGANGQAAVIDPRRDVEVYEEIAAENNARISYIFETHRNEDLVSGAGLLAEYSGATVYHGPNAAGEVRYAETTHHGNTVQLGDLRLQVMETPVTPTTVFPSRFMTMPVARTPLRYLPVMPCLSAM